MMMRRGRSDCDCECACCCSSEKAKGCQCSDAPREKERTTHAEKEVEVLESHSSLLVSATLHEHDAETHWISESTRSLMKVVSSLRPRDSAAVAATAISSV